MISMFPRDQLFRDRTNIFASKIDSIQTIFCFDLFVDKMPDKRRLVTSKFPFIALSRASGLIPIISELYQNQSFDEQDLKP